VEEMIREGESSSGTIGEGGSSSGKRDLFTRELEIDATKYLKIIFQIL